MTNEPADSARRPPYPGHTGSAEEFNHDHPAGSGEGRHDGHLDPPTGRQASPEEGVPVDLNKPGDPPLASPIPPPGPLWPHAETGEPRAETGEPGAENGDSGAKVGAGTTSDQPAGGSEPGADAAGHTMTDLPPLAEPPPPLAAITARYGLVRPLHGRYFAGVCAAIGRATNTDPVLWRVLFAVLTFFGGVGLLAYLAGWLLIPADGDTAAPLEATLGGRGRSRTSGPVVLAGLVAALLIFVAFAAEGIRAAAIGSLLVLGSALLLSRGKLQRSGGGQQPAGPGSVPPLGNPYEPYQTYPSYQAYQGTGGYGAGQPAAPAAPATPAAATDPTEELTKTAQPETPASAAPTTSPTDPFTPRGPFAPYGPFAPHGPFAARPFSPADPNPPGTPVSGTPLLAYPGLPRSVPPLPPKPRPRRPKSRLGRATFSAILLAIGALLLVDIAGVSVLGSAYPAAALTVTALGLLAGTWFGRSRLLIVLGLGLSLGLGISSIPFDHDFRHQAGDRVWAPRSVDEISSDEYNLEVGSGTLDLRSVDFTGRDVSVRARVELGKLTILLPPNVDVDIRGEVELGEAEVLNNRWNAIDDGERRVSDYGPDGPGGGNLSLKVKVETGKLEVTR